MKPSPDYQAFVDAFLSARDAPLPSPRPRLAPVQAGPDQPIALILAPHPDDEVLMGALPLRWQLERGWAVHVLALTLGSDPARRAQRAREMADACALLGWNLDILGWSGLAEGPGPAHPARIDTLRQKWAALQPAALFFPHPRDGHPTHTAVHHLARAALTDLNVSPAVFLTEFWQPMEHPNLLVEVPPPHLALLVEALACHAGEIARNPYHRTLPAWMMDNVRRGAEKVHPPGSPAPDFPFGALYHAESPPAHPILRAQP